MLNDFTKEIIAQFSSLSDEWVIGWNSRAKLTSESFGIIKNALDLTEHRLSYIDCAGNECYAEVEVKRKRDGSRYVQCYECHKLDLIDDNQDLAHRVTLDGVANFLINLIKIRPDKRPIEDNNIIYLGKMNGEKNLTLNVYLVRRKGSKDSLLKYLSLTSEKVPLLVIQLHNECWSDVDNMLFQVGFSDLVSYCEKLKKFIVNSESFSYQIKDYLAKKVVATGLINVHQNNKKYAAGGKNKRSVEKKFFKEAFEKEKRANIAKDDKEIILEIWDLNKDKALNNLSKTNGLRTLNDWHKKLFNT